MGKFFDFCRFQSFVLAAGLILCPLSRVLPAQDNARAIPAILPAELINQVVQNELADRGRADVWLYHVEHTQSQHTESRIQADTKAGPIYRVLARDGVPLTENQRRVEDVRISSLLSNNSLQAKNRQQHIEDEKHLENLIALMPKAFLYDYDGFESGKLRLRFRPNPNFIPPTYEGRVFHGLAGMMLVDLEQKRIARMAGTLEEPVEFGYGILGKLEKGGTFEFRRVNAMGDRWKTSFIELHILGRIALFKSVARDQKEVRSNFEALPPGTTLQEAKVLIYR